MLHLIEKKHTDSIKIIVSPKDHTFRHIGRGLKSYYDRDLLQEHLPPTIGVLDADRKLVESLSDYLPAATITALENTEFVNVFGRIVVDERNPRVKCLQYLYVWDYQAVPEHEADYEPVFVFLDGHRKYAIYDLVHYCTRELDLTELDGKRNALRMVPGWHSFLPASNIPDSEIDSGLEVMPLSDMHLDSWWSIPDEEPRLKIDGFLRNPFGLKAPGHFMDNPDEESKTFCCTFKEIEHALQEYENPKEGMIEGIRRAFTKCVGIFAIYRLGAFVKLLMEMNDVGIVKAPASLRAGLNLASIGAALKEGFVSLTNGGSKFFESMKQSNKEKND